MSLKVSFDGVRGGRICKWSTMTMECVTVRIYTCYDACVACTIIAHEVGSFTCTFLHTKANNLHVQYMTRYKFC